MIGRTGKGEKDTYKHFCKFCHKEFVIDMPKCYHCKRDTVTFKERYAELVVKCDEYKKSKIKRVDRKAKWELWKKT